MSNPLRGEVAFSEAGEGIVLRCLPSDLMKLTKEFGRAAAYEADADLSEFSRVVAKLERLDPDIVIAATKVFSKGGADKRAPAQVDVDAVDITFGDLKIRLLDAIYLGVYGKTYVEHVTEMAKMLDAMRGEPEKDERPPEDSSD